MASLTHTLGIRHPIVCAPMAGVAGGRLAHAVSAAGGLGMIGARGSATSEWIAEQAALAGEGGTPFGIGLMAWVPQLSTQLDAVLALPDHLRPALVSVSFGDLAAPTGRLREAGLRTACQVGNAADLDAALGAGADVIVARGGEGGGHGRDEVGARAMLDLALSATDTPVLAAGGIATAEDVARALAVGAAGVWCGTAFLTCREGDNSPQARAALIGAVATRYSRVHDVAQGIAWPREFGGRAVATPFVEEWAGAEETMTPEAKAEHAAGRDRADTDYTPLYAGVGVGRLGAETDAASVVAALAGRG
ncbi:NAD(P)H-dependent flavin oxidoreductase [Janibacter sp. GS2]|uniref:NAD(P)H-dependent flavin oxidoreductase n=1 Tax=Janibacter sp. GS2 TaxID=3442646 RepID=UPI003EBBF170